MDDIKYNKNNFKFTYRVSAIIYNSDKTKVLLFCGDDKKFYMIPGGKVQEQERSIDAIRREIKEELGFENLDFIFSGISEEIVTGSNECTQQITITYNAIYNGFIPETYFKSIESDWINFRWINIDELDTIEIHPQKIKNHIKDESKIYHIVEKVEH